MFPTTGHLINAIFGTSIQFPIPTYGLMLSTAFLLAWLISMSEMKRKQKLGFLNSIKTNIIRGAAPGYADLIPAAVFGFILGWKFVGILFHYGHFNANPVAYFFSSQGSLLSGLLLAAGFVGWEYYSMKKKQLPNPVKETIDVPAHKLMPMILMIAAAGGIAGAKLFHILENLGDFSRDPWRTVFSTGGLTFYGGLIAGTLLVVWYCKRKKLDVFHMMDVTAPAILIAYAIGRTGCMLAGDGCWGIENLNPKPEWLTFLPDWMWAFNFPHNVVNEGVLLHDCGGQYCHVLENPVYPTPFYETSLNLIFFLIVWGIRKHMKTPGILFAIAFIMNGVERFFIEKIRINNKFDFWGMKVTQAEIISLLLVIVGIALAIWLTKRHRKQINKTTG